MGEGGEYRATLIEVGNKKAIARIDAFEDVNRTSPLAIHMGIGISRGDRFDPGCPEGNRAGSQ